MSCSNCFSDYVCKCLVYDETIVINTFLTPGEAVRVIFTDKFEQNYEVDVTVESDGTIIVPLAYLPEGFLNQYAGLFYIRIENLTTCGSIKFPITQMYDCIELQVRGGTMTKNTIGCPVPCSGGGASNAIVEFVDNNHVTIDWSQFINNFGNYPQIQVYFADDELPNIYNLVSVEVLQVRNQDGILQSIEIDMGGPADGYVLITS